MPENEFSSQVVLITGAGTGIGKEAAEEFARRNALVVLCGRRIGPLAETARNISAAGGSCEVCSMDVGDEISVSSGIKKIIAKYGRIDICFLSAGVAISDEIINIKLSDFEKTMTSNCTGVLLCLKHILPFMYAARTGSVIVNLSVHSEKIIFPGTAAYSASKHAAAAITKSAAIESAQFGVRVNAVAPGPTLTKMLEDSCESKGGIGFWAEKIPVKRVGQPCEVVSAAVWLASRGASYVTGTILNVDGGFAAI